MRTISRKEWGYTVALLGVIFIAGLLMRIFFVRYLTYEDLHLGTGYTHDEYNYIHMVRYFFSHGIYSYYSGAPDALVTPGYPMFLGMIFFIFGSGDSGIFTVKMVQALLSSLSSLLIWLLVVQLTKRNKGALLAAALFAFSPPAALYSRFILTETLYIFLILLYANLHLRGMKMDQIKFHVLAGLFFGLAMMVRPMAFYLAPLPYVWKAVETRDWKKWLKLFLIFFLPIFLIFMPWTIRNLVVLGKWIPLCSQTNPFYAGIWEDMSAISEPDGGFLSNLRLLFSLFLQKPFEIIKWFFYKKVNIIFAWSAYWLPQDVSWFIPLDNMLNIFIKGTGLLGLLVGLLNHRFRLFSVCLSCYMLMALLFVPNSRFGLQYLPFLCALSGIATSILLEKETS